MTFLTYLQARRKSHYNLKKNTVGDLVSSKSNIGKLGRFGRFQQILQWKQVTNHCSSRLAKNRYETRKKRRRKILEKFEKYLNGGIFLNPNTHKNKVTRKVEFKLFLTPIRSHKKYTKNIGPNDIPSFLGSYDGKLKRNCERVL